MVPERTITLIAADGAGKEITFALGAEPKLVGRTVKIGVRIEDSRISRRHATFRLDGDAILLADEGSANGTFVNDQRIKVQQVKDGDVIKFGAAAFRLKAG